MIRALEFVKFVQDLPNNPQEIGENKPFVEQADVIEFRDTSILDTT